MLTERQRDQVWRIALAALLHDVGKLAQRAEADPERYRSLPNLHLFARTDERGATSYHHAAYTWEFLETHAPWLAGIGEGGDQNIAAWAARHHKPSSAWDHVVAEADRLSAGMDRGHADEAVRGWAAVQGARLTPLLAEIAGFDRAAEFELSLGPLELGRALFPREATTRSPTQALDEYRRQFDGFARTVEEIPGGDVHRFFTSLLAVYERFAWCVPAATNAQPRDVSLFEHSRVASAIAAAMAAQLLAAGELSEARIRGRTEPRYLLAVGDLFGIQGFLYTIVSKHAARALRGRSFFLQLLADAVAGRILDAFGLPPASCLYFGGGKLWLLLPLGAEDALARLGEEIDLELQRDFAGKLGFAVGAARLAGEDLLSGRIPEHFRAATDDLQARRRRRLAVAARARFDDVFAPCGDPAKEGLCHVCGKLSAGLVALSEEEERQACPECRKLEELGALLPRARSIVRVAGNRAGERLARCEQRLRDRGARIWRTRGDGLAGLGSAYLATDAEPATALAAAGSGDVVFALNDFGVSPKGEAALAVLLTGLGRARDDADRTLTFEDLAERSQGIERLGVLRMDVDSLGEKLARGFVLASPAGPTDYTTISRLTNLSKSLAYFFGGFVSALIAEPGRGWSGAVELIYSGGDDVFVVGAWSALPALAREIRHEIGRFTGGNPAWGLSGGLAAVRAGHPIASSARMAGELEECAKAHRRRDGHGKDALGLLDEAFGWADVDAIAAVAGELLGLTGAETPAVPGFAEVIPVGAPLARSWLHRFSRIADAYRAARRDLESGERTRPIAELEEAARRGRWAWSAAYEVARAPRDPEVRSRLETLVAALRGKRPPQAPAGGAVEAESDLTWLLRPAAALADLLSRERRD